MTKQIGTEMTIHTLEKAKKTMETEKTNSVNTEGSRG